MEDTTGVRINKYLSEAGICSRRQADCLIAEGKVLINGKTAQPGQKVTASDIVICEGKTVTAGQKRVLLMLNKPVGIECTTDRRNPDNIVDYVGYPVRIYPVGRLDKNSCGLILLSNDGAFANQLMKAANYHEKEYIVTVNKPITKEFITQMAGGVHITASRNGAVILDAVTRPCPVKQIGERTFQIILTQGLNRQIRRMCQALGYEVKTLKRIRIVNLELGTLKEGQWKAVTPQMWQALEQAMAENNHRRVQKS